MLQPNLWFLIRELEEKHKELLTELFKRTILPLNIMDRLTETQKDALDGFLAKHPISARNDYNVADEELNALKEKLLRHQPDDASLGSNDHDAMSECQSTGNTRDASGQLILASEAMLGSFHNKRQTNGAENGDCLYELHSGSSDEENVASDEPIRVGRKSNCQSFQAKMVKPSKKAKNDKLYQLQAWRININARPLSTVMNTAPIAVMTKDWQLLRDEIRQLHVLRRIDELKDQNLWSFRQMKPHHPLHPKTHRDYLIAEMKWMYTDFHQERKWKRAAAYTMARWVLEWHCAEDKSLVCIAPKPTRHLTAKEREIATQKWLSGDNDLPSAESTEDVEFKEPFKPASLLQNGKSAELESGEDASGSTVPSEANNAPEMAVDNQIASEPVNLHSEESSKKSQYEESSNSYKHVTMNLEAHVYSVGDKDSPESVLHSFPTYLPPKYDDAPRAAGLEIIPVSKFNWRKTVVADVSSWDPWGRPKKFTPSQESVKWLPLSSRYDSVQQTGLFSAMKDKAATSTEESTKPIIEPLSEKPTSITPSSWSPDEDEAIWCLSKQYGSNWSLIASCLMNMNIGVAKERTDWECYTRFLELKGQGFKSSSRCDYVYAPPTRIGKTTLSDNKTKALRLFGTFDAIKKCTKKRDLQRSATINKPLKTHINLTAHETHGQVLQAAGIDPSQPPLTPFDVSVLKERRDKIQIEQQRQFLFPTRQTPFPRAGPQTPFLAGGRGQGVTNGIGGPLIGAVGGLTPDMAALNSPNLQSLSGSNDAFVAGSPPQLANLTPEQLQAFLASRKLMARGAAIPGGSPEMNALAGIQGQAGLGAMTPAMLQRLQLQRMQQANKLQQRTQIQADASTAAAFVALQNAQQALKMNQLTPEMIQRQFQYLQMQIEKAAHQNMQIQAMLQEATNKGQTADAQQLQQMLVMSSQQLQHHQMQFQAFQQQYQQHNAMSNQAQPQQPQEEAQGLTGATETANDNTATDAEAKPQTKKESAATKKAEAKREKTEGSASATSETANTTKSSPAVKRKRQGSISSVASTANATTTKKDDEALQMTTKQDSKRSSRGRTSSVNQKEQDHDDNVQIKAPLVSTPETEQTSDQDSGQDSQAEHQPTKHKDTKTKAATKPPSSTRSSRGRNTKASPAAEASSKRSRKKKESIKVSATDIEMSDEGVQEEDDDYEEADNNASVMGVDDEVKVENEDDDDEDDDDDEVVLKTTKTGRSRRLESNSKLKVETKAVSRTRGTTSRQSSKSSTRTPSSGTSVSKKGKEAVVEASDAEDLDEDSLTMNEPAVVEEASKTSRSRKKKSGVSSTPASVATEESSPRRPRRRG